MARCPSAEWHRVPGAEPAITPTQFIFHTAVVRDLFDLEAYFSGPSGGIEAHFGVGGKWGRSLAQDGQARQWRDTEEQADANRTANVRAISVETCDNAPRSASDIEPWTPKQAAKLVKLGIWARTTHSIPARICRTPDDPGFGWHAMWDNTRFELADGSTPWTPSAGKVCPGPVRIRQLQQVVLPAIFAGTQLEEDDLPYTEAQLTEFAYQGALDGHRRAAGGNREAEVSKWYDDLDTKVNALVVKVDALARIELTPQQIIDLAKAIVDNQEIAGHPTLIISGTAAPPPPV